MNTTTADQYLMALTRLNDELGAMDAGTSAIHDMLEDGLFSDAPSNETISEPALVLLPAPSTRLRPSALAA